MERTAKEDRAGVEKDVNATIKDVMLAMEELAGLPPEVANNPHTFNAHRNRLIRRIWDTMKECMRYGARTAQRDQHCEQCGPRPRSETA